MDGDLLTKSAIDIYRSLDTNGDGQLDKDEVMTSLAKFGYSKEESDKILNALDKGSYHHHSFCSAIRDLKESIHLKKETLCGAAHTTPHPPVVEESLAVLSDSLA